MVPNEARILSFQYAGSIAAMMKASSLEVGSGVLPTHSMHWLIIIFLCQIFGVQLRVGFFDYLTGGSHHQALFILDFPLPIL